MIDIEKIKKIIPYLEWNIQNGLMLKALLFGKYEVSALYAFIPDTIGVTTIFSIHYIRTNLAVYLPDNKEQREELALLCHECFKKQPEVKIDDEMKRWIREEFEKELTSNLVNL